MVSFPAMPSPSSVFSAYASMSASLMLFRTMFNQLVPHQLQRYILTAIRFRYSKPQPSKITLIIEEKDGMKPNQIFGAAEIYLSSKITTDAERLKISKTTKENHISVRFAGCGDISDVYEGVSLKWRFVSDETKKSNPTSPVDEDFSSHGNNNNYRNHYSSLETKKRYFELIFDKKRKEKVLDSYLPFVIHKAKLIEDEQKTVKLHTLSDYSANWDSINLQHPSTFDKLAMDPGIKKAVMEDLDRFLRRKEFYRKVGKAWKRGYLLYGPPGTGKSSLIAAMANYLNFDIYDLQLMNVRSDSGLRKMLLSTANRSILVIEDIDCSLELPDRNVLPPQKSSRDLQFSLSGLLNFIDGLWSSCGDERIFILTTNNKEALDPALLRPGRMDMHVHMTYLTSHGFKLLASNYLNIHDHHWLFGEIEELIEGMKVTPAEVAEELMKTSDADLSLGGLVNFLKRKKMESNGTTDDGIQTQEVKRLKIGGCENNFGQSENNFGSMEFVQGRVPGIPMRCSPLGVPGKLSF